MTPGKRNSRQGGIAEAEAAVDLTALQQLCNHEPVAGTLCGEIAKAFHVLITEVALLRREGDCLKFIFPLELRDVGSIPLSSSAVAAHTAVTKRVNLFNRFTRVKHASVFEVVKLHAAGDADEPQREPIQKLISAPVLDGDGKVVGVIQVCRKGSESCLAGPDFTRNDLQQLESAAKMLAGIPSLWATAK